LRCSLCHSPAAPERRPVPNLRLLGWLALWVFASSWLSSLASAFIANTLLADVVSQVMSIVLGLLALQPGMGA